MVAAKDLPSTGLTKVCSEMLRASARVEYVIQRLRYCSGKQASQSKGVSMRARPHWPGDYLGKKRLPVKDQISIIQAVRKTPEMEALGIPTGK